jgi:acyl-CoA thioester hydrolase
MSEYRFFHPMEVRYADIDAQGHLNNAKYLTFFEQARVHYLTELGLFAKGQSFDEIGVIIADIHIRYKAPVVLGTSIKVGVRTSDIGGKSLTLQQCLADAESDRLYAVGTVILVAYDYAAHASMAVPEKWRETIARFEGLPLK